MFIHSWALRSIIKFTWSMWFLKNHSKTTWIQVIGDANKLSRWWWHMARSFGRRFGGVACQGSIATWRSLFTGRHNHLTIKTSQFDLRHIYYNYIVWFDDFKSCCMLEGSYGFLCISKHSKIGDDYRKGFLFWDSAFTMLRRHDLRHSHDI